MHIFISLELVKELSIPLSETLSQELFQLESVVFKVFSFLSSHNLQKKNKKEKKKNQA